MRVIGIDPGSRICGYGVIESRGGEIRHLTSGAIAPGNSLPLNQRLGIIHESLMKVIGEHSPEAMSVEDIFSRRTRRAR